MEIPPIHHLHLHPGIRVHVTDAKTSNPITLLDHDRDCHHIYHSPALGASPTRIFLSEELQTVHILQPTFLYIHSALYYCSHHVASASLSAFLP